MKKIISGLTIIMFLGTWDSASLASEAVAQNKNQNPKTGLKTVDSKGAKAVLTKQPATIVLDVRTPQEYNSGHLKNANNLDYNAPDFAAKLARLDKNKTYLVYCAVGGRSSKAAKLMQEQGFRQVFNVSEGFTSMKKVGVAVVE